MVQDRDALADRSGRSLFDFQNYQVTVSEIEEFTGTEPVVRVMVEGEDKCLVEELARDLAGAVEQALS